MKITNYVVSLMNDGVTYSAYPVNQDEMSIEELNAKKLLVTKDESNIIIQLIENEEK